jgi:hypothetical protein
VLVALRQVSANDSFKLADVCVAITPFLRMQPSRGFCKKVKKKAKEICTEDLSIQWCGCGREEAADAIAPRAARDRRAHEGRGGAWHPERRVLSQGLGSGLGFGLRVRVGVTASPNLTPNPYPAYLYSQPLPLP